MVEERERGEPDAKSMPAPDSVVVEVAPSEIEGHSPKNQEEKSGGGFWGSLSWSYPTRTPPPTQQKAKVQRSTEGEQTTIANSQEMLSPNFETATHLVVLAHGLHGGTDDLVRVAGILSATYGQELALLISESNQGFLATHRGIDVGGERLAKEVAEFANKMATCHTRQGEKFSFSIIGHSLGGLYSRYCIGHLYSEGFFDQWQPLNFITLATPHLGSRRPQRGLNPILSFFTSHLFSRTGQQLMLEDDEREKPLLVRMCDRELSFFKALALFRRRSIYANVLRDLQVPFSTSAIMPYNPFTSLAKELKVSKKYGCVLEEPIPFAFGSSTATNADEGLPSTGAVCEPTQNREESNIDNESSGSTTRVDRIEERHEEGSLNQMVDNVDSTCAEGLNRTSKSDCEEEERDHCDFYKNDTRGEELRGMLETLNSLEWERFGVALDNFLSHVNIVCKKTILEKVTHLPLTGRYKDELDGANHIGFGVLQHLVDHFLLNDERLDSESNDQEVKQEADTDVNDISSVEDEKDDSDAKLKDNHQEDRSNDGAPVGNECLDNVTHETDVKGSGWKVWKWFSPQS